MSTKLFRQLPKSYPIPLFRRGGSRPYKQEIFLINTPQVSHTRWIWRQVPSGGISVHQEPARLPFVISPNRYAFLPIYPVPLKDENSEVVGVLALGRSLERENRETRNLSDFLNQSVDTVRKQPKMFRIWLS